MRYLAGTTTRDIKGAALLVCSIDLTVRYSQFRSVFRKASCVLFLQLVQDLKGDEEHKLDNIVIQFLLGTNVFPPRFYGKSTLNAIKHPSVHSLQSTRYT